MSESSLLAADLRNSAGTGPVRKRTLKRYLVIGVLVYLLIACLAYWPVSPLSRTQIVTCGCYDIAEQTWFLAWTPFAILHHLNPFATNYLNYPVGVNLAANTLMPLFGVLAAPVTLTLGPVAALNVLMRLAFASSATSMFFVLRRWTKWQSAAYVGGLLYGFSPYLMAQGSLHLDLLFVPLPPIILAILDELFVRQRRSVRAMGVLLGLVCAAQYLISSEILATTALMAFVGIVALALTHRHEVVARSRYALSGIAWAAPVFLVICAYPIWYFFAGPLHLSGPIQPIYTLQGFRSDLLGAIVPTRSQRIGPANLIAIGSNYAGGNLPENGSYLGIPLILATVGILALIRHRAGMLRFAAFMALIAEILSLGPRLTVNNHVTGFLLPFSWFSSIPLLRNEVPLRYTLYLQLFVAVIFAIGLDRLLGARTYGVGRFTFETKRGFLAAGMTVAALVPVIPNFPYLSEGSGVPSYFSSPQVKALHQGSVLLAYPYPIYPDNLVMLWQAESSMKFRIIGGYEVTPDANGDGTLDPSVLSPTVTEALFTAAMYGPSKFGYPLPPRNEMTYAALRAFLTKYDVSTIVVSPIGTDPIAVVGELRRAIGKPIDYGGLYVWQHVQIQLSRLAARKAPAKR